MRFDGRRDDASAINALKTHSFPFATEALEIPPWNPILRADDRGAWSQYRLQLGRKFWQAVRLYAKKDNVYRSHFFEGTGNSGPCQEISLATFHLHAAFPHGPKVRATSKEGDVESSPCHAGADISAD
jgi:hypothetical protein